MGKGMPWRLPDGPERTGGKGARGAVLRDGDVGADAVVVDHVQQRQHVPGGLALAIDKAKHVGVHLRAQLTLQDPTSTCFSG